MCYGDQSRLWLGLFLELGWVQSSHQEVDVNLGKALSIHTIWMNIFYRGVEHMENMENMREIGVKKGAMGIRGTMGEKTELYIWARSKVY